MHHHSCVSARPHRCCSHHGEALFDPWHHHYPREGFGGGPFGVRRPLRFLAFKLQLDERQVTELASVLSELKTERAQAEVDDRRALGIFADAIGAESFEESRAVEGSTLRVKSAERLQQSVVRALSRIHALLDAEQRSRLAYLIRTGALMV
jgi:hypothetical protein